MPKIKKAGARLSERSHDSYWLECHNLFSIYMFYLYVEILSLFKYNSVLTHFCDIILHVYGSVSIVSSAACKFGGF